MTRTSGIADDRGLNDGSFIVDLPESARNLYAGVHGGYLAAVALHAATQRLEAVAPRSLSMHFLRPAKIGPVTVNVTVERQGRLSSVSSVVLAQDGRKVAIGRTVHGAAVPQWQAHPERPHEVAPPSECGPSTREPAPWLGIQRRPAGPVNTMWMRRDSDQPLDEVSLTVLADGMIPEALALLDGEPAVPTVELDIHFADVPAAAAAGPWVLGHVRDRYIVDGWASDDAELWSSSGVLALTSRQLRRIVSAADLP